MKHIKKIDSATFKKNAELKKVLKIVAKMKVTFDDCSLPGQPLVETL